MSDFLDRIGKLSPSRLALLALEQHEQLEAERARARAPVAIVGIGCRFPGGADGPDAFWGLLREGRDATGPIPSDRWDAQALFDADPDAPGRIAVRSGAFLERVDGFDAPFFGISPREARTMDPQQRLLLEVAWEALEHAAIAPDALAGMPVGVFVGLCNNDHFQRVLRHGTESIDAHVASGNAPSVAAGRIAYCLGLQGPAVTVDTACSSSLVALHLAVQSVRRGESRIAIAGGVNVICSPETMIALSRGHMLAPDGRCKTFDAAADGFARGEGCGLVVLKPLDAAVADGDRVLAVIRGSAVNQDGRSGGLTVPNGPAQEAVIRAALEDAGIGPADVDYVEAHGTGTSLGDPIEVKALAAALGAGRPAGRPLRIGSVKTNIGHLESAAGVAGVIKTVLALANERIPPHLHFTRPNPHIDWAAYPVEVPVSGMDWPRGERRRCAGVSSFGFSGTNAHLVLEEAPPVASAQGTAVADETRCLPLSARTGEALRRIAARVADALVTPDAPSLDSVVRTLGCGRASLPERAAVIASSPAEASAALRAFASGEIPASVRTGRAVPGARPEVVFMFPGQGSQYPGMARELYRHVPAFAAVIDRCDALLGSDSAGRTLKSVLWPEDPSDGTLHDTAWTQPALFAVEYGLAQAWRAWGVEPAAVIGHSVGEYVAACVAGVFTLEEGLALIAERGRLMAALPPGGSMAALFAPVADVSAAIAASGRRVSIAAVNAADSVVVAGESGEVDGLIAVLADRGVRGHRLHVSLAAHSPLVEPALEAMQACAGRVRHRPPGIPVAWNLTGGAPLPGDGAPDPVYWRRHLREPVRFADGLATLHRDGFRCFLEVGPHPVLVALAQRTLPEDSTLLVASLRRGRPDVAELMQAVAALHADGVPLAWREIAGPGAGTPASMPTYPFERSSYWLPVADAAAPSVASDARRPLLGQRLATAVPTWQARLAPDAPAWLGQHRVGGTALVAAPIYLAMAHAAASLALQRRPIRILGFRILEPLDLGGDGRTLQVSLASDDATAPGDEVAFAIHAASPGGTGAWHLHARGRVGTAVNPPTPPGDGLERLLGLESELGEQRPADAHYQRLEALGIELGGPFRSMTAYRRHADRALVALALPASVADAPIEPIHPGLLDGALQAVGLAIAPEAGEAPTMLLAGIESVELSERAAAAVWAYVEAVQASGEAHERRADVELLDACGTEVGRLAGVTLRRVAAARAGHEPVAYRVEWIEGPPASRAARSFPAPSDFAQSLEDEHHRAAETHGLAIYDELLPELERLATAHVGGALRGLGFEDRIGREFDASAEADRLGVVAGQRRLFERLLGMLAEDGVLEPRPTAGTPGWRVAARLPDAPPADAYPRATARFEEVRGELSLLARVGPSLGGVLAGRVDPLELLFPGGSLAEARELYVDSPFARTFNGSVRAALRAATGGLPADARTRIVEIGAGTGGTTEYLLDALEPDRTEYVFTDVGPTFLAQAATRYAGRGFVRTARLDIEHDPVAQGFAAGSFDVVVAANVLHATARLADTLGHVLRLLAPGGLLLLLEGVRPQRWIDVTFGLTEGWWRFSDVELRADQPLLSVDGWRRLLGSAGFVDVRSIGGDTDTGRGGQALFVARAGRGPAGWRVVGAGSSDTLAAAIAERLAARGDAVEVSEAGDPAPEHAADRHLLYVASASLADVAPDDPVAPEVSARLAAVDAQRWLAAWSKAPGSSRAWLVTRGAQPVDGPSAPGARWQAPAWGLGRVFALEHPDRWGAAIDVDPVGSVESASEAVAATLDEADAEDQVAWRHGRRSIARLREVPAEPAGSLSLGPGSTYLVTGGFGGLGPLVARWFADRGARHVALLGRNVPEGAPIVGELAARGVQVIPLAADVSDESSLRSALERLRAVAPPLRGIVHAAAAYAAAPIAAADADAMRAVLAAKLAGTAALLRSVGGEPLDFVVLFSSTTALLGAAGLGAYAAGNAFLGACARPAGPGGARVLAIDWGTWEAMRLASDDARRDYREAGLLPMPAREALRGMERALADPTVERIALASIDWAALKPLHESRRVRPLLSEVGRASATPPGSSRVRSGDAGGGAASLLESLRSTPVAQRADRLVAVVRAEVARVLGAPEIGSVQVTTGLFDLGMDSLMAVELRKRLEVVSGLDLPSTLTFNYPNVLAIAGFLEANLGLPVGGGAPDGPVPAPPPDPADLATGDAGLDELTDDELEARLLASLERSR